MVRIRTLTADDAELYRNIRLEALRGEPFAFSSSADEYAVTTVESVAAALREMPAHNFTMGAFEDGRLLGTATFIRETKLKERHKGNIYGVYVAPEHRGKGVASALLGAIISRAREDSSLEQLLISVGTGQTGAFQLYRKLGFAIYGTEPWAVKVGERYVDEHHMVLPLQ